MVSLSFKERWIFDGSIQFRESGVRMAGNMLSLETY